jgi:hypothetical protein
VALVALVRSPGKCLASRSHFFASSDGSCCLRLAVDQMSAGAFSNFHFMEGFPSPKKTSWVELSFRHFSAMFFFHIK